ncbi:MAG: pyridoxine 5'-phosphate synthase [Flavobacteriales bacterium]
MTKLSVNINKVATLRNARGGNVPDVVRVAKDLESFGADGITVHPRPDERHIRKSDVFALKEVITTEFNIEGYPSEDFLQLIESARPHQVTLVPDPPHVLTSNAGWNCREHQVFLQSMIERIKQTGARVSIFLNPQPEEVAYAASTGADRIELYTEAYASGYIANREQAIQPYIETALAAHAAGLGINAGHDLSLENLSFFSKHIPQLDEVSIGHALIADALYFGLENTVQMYQGKLGK